MNDSIVKKAISVITVLICVYAVYFFRDLFGYLLISVGLSFAGRPIVDLVSKVKIKGKSLSSSIGAIIAMTCFILAGAVVIGLFGPLISTQAEALAASWRLYKITNNFFSSSAQPPGKSLRISASPFCLVPNKFISEP